MNKNNKEIKFNGDDLIKSVESFVGFCQQNPAFVDYINSRLEKSESTPISCPNCNKMKEYEEFVDSLLSPEQYGYAVSAEVRDQARILKGMKPVESKLKK